MSWTTYLETHADRFLNELRDFLRIPSISSLPEHDGDVAEAATWVAARLRAAGAEQVQILPTGAQPIVYGQWLGAPGRPTILIYGHYDVQPVDPVDQWHNPPFEPTLQDGRIVARGASDDKGNMLVPILACEALLQSAGTLPVNVKFLFEGQEEIGSPNLGPFVAAHRELLACDLVLSADGLQYAEDRPNLLVSLKGLCALQLDVRGANSDLHSGLHGGEVQNPIHALVQLLASMRGRDGRILVDGFYDDVAPLSDQDRALIAAVPYDEAAVRAALDVPALFGEAGYTPRERAWARPTLEINGIWGGFQDPGVKTVIPAQAHAKITCRLTANQVPERIVDRIQAHVRTHAPPGVTVTVTPQASRADPYLMPSDHPGNRAAHQVLAELYGQEPYYTRLGGSIPFCAIFLQALGVYTVSYGFGLPDEKFHAPNEFFRVRSFRRGQVAYGRLLSRLADFSPESLAGRAPG